MYKALHPFIKYRRRATHTRKEKRKKRREKELGKKGEAKEEESGSNVDGLSALTRNDVR